MAVMVKKPLSVPVVKPLLNWKRLVYVALNQRTSLADIAQAAELVNLHRL